MKALGPGPCGHGDCERPRELHSKQRVRRAVNGVLTSVVVEFYRSTCAGHRQRKKRKRTVDGAIKEYARAPLDGLYKAALEYKDELDTATDEEFTRSKERFREALRRYLVKYVPDLLKRQQFSPPVRAEVDSFIRKYASSR